MFRPGDLVCAACEARRGMRGCGVTDVWVVLELSDYEQSWIVGVFRDKASADVAVAENELAREAYKERLQ